MNAQARYSFLLKIGGALLLVALADLLFWRQWAGSTIGLFAVSLLVVAACLRLEMFARWPSRLAFAAAVFFALVLLADPGLPALLLYWTALSLAVLLPRLKGFDNGARWALRLAWHGVISLVGPLRDLRLLARARRWSGAPPVGRKLHILVLPLGGSAIFLLLFAQANPLIAEAFNSFDPGLGLNAETVIRAIYWGIVFTIMWSVLRPSRALLDSAAPGSDEDLALPGVGIASVTLSLIAFNLIFALQNGLDIAFLWTGAHLPDGMTYAGYAHQGAYPLIVTALLAALFVLLTLQPGSPTARSRPIRLLVTIWIGQNVLLVASTMLRTFNYIEAYSLTVLRISALIWMGLVAVGLILICYRLLTGKSAAWLINANLLAAFLTLAACTTVDLGRMSAAWNVRHAREVGGSGVALDLCYLNELGPSALLPLIELESRPLPADLRIRAALVRSRILQRLEPAQADWHGWTLRNSIRLDRARELIAEHRLPVVPDRGDRQCDGRPYPPPPPPVVEAPKVEPSNEAAPAVETMPEAANALTGTPER